jgi:hypothetical protein
VAGQERGGGGELPVKKWAGPGLCLLRVGGRTGEGGGGELPVKKWAGPGLCLLRVGGRTGGGCQLSLPSLHPEQRGGGREARGLAHLTATPHIRIYTKYNLQNIVKQGSYIKNRCFRPAMIRLIDFLASESVLGMRMRIKIQEQKIDQN